MSKCEWDELGWSWCRPNLDLDADQARREDYLNGKAGSTNSRRVDLYCGNAVEIRYGGQRGSYWRVAPR